MSNNILDEKLACFAEGIGRHVGELVRCIVQQEIAAKTQQIEQLQTMLSGMVCLPVSATAETEPPASSTAGTTNQ